MTTVGGLFQKYSSITATNELCAKLGPFLTQDGSPKTVKCTKRLYNSFVKHLDAIVSNLHYENIGILFTALGHIAKGSNDFDKLLSFGLTKKILSWCETLFIQNPAPDNEEWSKMVDDVLFNMTVTLGHLEVKVQQEMVPLLSCLLKCVCSGSVPCTAKIEAARGSNILLEACTVEYKSSLSRMTEMTQLIESMGRSIQYAGNFELQVTIAECLYRMTTTTERISLARKWFEQAPPNVLKRFTTIREEEFEVDCRVFLNELNSTVKERTVFSISCKRMFLGTHELYCPEDESLNSFWVDFNLGSNSVTVFVDDPTNADTNTPPEESAWEMVTIKKAIVDHWTVKVQGGDLVLTVLLKCPAHTLLPSIPFSKSRDITIVFDRACDPTNPTMLVFGSPKQQRDSAGQSVRSTSHIEKAKERVTKQSSAVNHIHINQTAQRLNRLQEISPIEVPPDTPALGGHVNSQGSTTPTNQCVVPLATPATSTPKPRLAKKAASTHTKPTPPCRPHPPVTPTSSTRNTRPPLTFVSSGSIVNAPKRNSQKSSLTVNAILFESGTSRVVQTNGGRSLKSCSAERKPTCKDGVQSTKSKRDLSLSKTSSVKVKPSTYSTTANKMVDKEIEHLTSKPLKNSQTRLDFKTPSGRTQSGNPTRKQLSQLANFQHFESPDQEDTNSPVLDYEVPSAALREKLQSQETRQEEVEDKQTPCPKPSVSSKTSSHTSSPNSGYMDSNPYSPPLGKNTCGYELENNDSSMDSLCEMPNQSGTNGKKPKRVFNLSGAPIVKDKKLKEKKLKQTLSRSSSLSSTCVSDSEPVAIPDSLPPNTSHNESQKTTSATKRRSKRLTVPNKLDSFDFESEDDNDQSWEPVGKTKSTNISRMSTKSVEEKENIPTKPLEKVKRAVKKSKPSLKVPKHMSKQERKRIIDDVYNGFDTPDIELPQPKISKTVAKPIELKKKQSLAGKSQVLNIGTASSKSKRNKLSPLKSKKITQYNVPEETSVAVSKHTVQKDKKVSKSNLLPKRKHHVVDHSDFDELLSTLPKKHKGRRSSGYFSQIDSPNNSIDDEISLEEKQDNDPTILSSDDTSTMSSKPQSIDEPVKEKGIDTHVTEEANVPESSEKHNPPPISSLPSSPCSSLHSSLVTADLNVTAGFEQICRSLISKSGVQLPPLKQPLQDKDCVSSVTRSELKSDPRNSEDVITEDEFVEQQEKDSHETISLTQLTRNIVNSHKQQRSKTAKVKTPLSGKWKTTTTSSRSSHYNNPKMTPSALCRPMADDQDVDSDVESEPSQKDTPSNYSQSGVQAGALDQLQDFEQPDAISTSPSSEKGEDEQRLLDYSSEMHHLVTEFDHKLQNASKKRRVQQKRTNSMAGQGELLSLWNSQQKEREQALKVYHEQLCHELQVLEKDVTVTQNSEEQTTALLKKQLKTLKQSLGKQQRQVDRLCTLQVSFHQHIGTLEKDQTKEQMGAQRSLKQEMHSLQKRLLGDYEKQEVSRIKHCLHAMLLQV